MVSEKDKLAFDQLLPLPAQANASIRTSRLRKTFIFVLLCSLLFAVHHCRVHNISNDHGHGRGHHLFGKRAEREFLAVPNGPSAIKASRLYATKPHMAGTPGDFTTAKDFLQLLQKELGISSPSSLPLFDAGSSDSQDATRLISKSRKPSAWIDTYYPVMNTPLQRNLQVIGDEGVVIWDADLVESADSTDPEAGKYFDDVPTFHGLSRGGDVTGKLVDGNYCTQEDYGKLVKKGVNLEGAIVMCRYGGIFRGLKVKGGQELGASGVLIYSDPRDDGTVTVENGYKPYPYGPARNPTSVQRGSVQYLSVYPGDPTTPGYPSYENSTRIEPSNIPLIPSLPISWSNAATLFRTLTKNDSWEGKLVRLNNNVDTRVIPIWNTMGVIPGFIKDEVVVIGNHRDAWVMGATDPSSGTASVHEVVRGLGHLLRRGWKPLRTIVIASWDAEEYGLIGSTEWGEDFADWIDEHVVAYLNLDSSVSGSQFRVSGSPLLAHFIRETAEITAHPTDKGRSLWDATTDVGKLFGVFDNSTSVDAEVISIKEMEYAIADSVGVSPLGSGSDYTVFLQRNGIPSTNEAFGGTPHDAAYHYHSVYDSERWQELYADPGFHRHVAVARHLGLQALRLSSSVILPFNTSHYAREVEAYLDRVQGLALAGSIEVDLQSLRKSIHALQAASSSLDKEKQNIHRELRKLAKKWKGRHAKLQRILKKLRKWRKKQRRLLRRIICRLSKIFGQPCHPHKCHETDEIQQVALDGLDSDDDMALGMLFHEGVQIEHIDSILAHPRRRHRRHRFPLKRLRKLAKRIRALNKKTSLFEKGFISEAGIKDREWYKHLGVAPGKWLGYGATTLPALTEAITIENDSTLAQHEADRLQGHLDKLVERIKV